MKGNKLFIKSMIVTAVIGLTTLMIFMFIGIKYFTEQKVEAVTPPIASIPLEKPSVPFKSIILGVINTLSNDEISIFDIEKKQHVKTDIKKMTRIEDEREKAIPLASLKVGEIVEISYEPAEDNLLSIKKSGQSWRKTNLKNVEISKSKSEIKIGSNTYTYDGNTLILDKEGNKLNNIHLIGTYDTLELTGVRDEVYSIKVLESGGFIQVEELPTSQGRIEIDINRQVNLEEITKPIPLPAGNHKIGIYLDGYEPIIKPITVASGETVIITPDNVQKTYYTLNVVVANGENNYTVEIEGKTYKPGEAIQLTKGKYKVSINKDGFEKWEQEILVEENRTVSALLTQIEKEATTEEVVVETDSAATSGSTSGMYTINLSTDPQGAEVYINGEFKGKTPYSTTLALGDYEVELRKEGYEKYFTSLIIDNSDSQNSYLYMLIPKSE